MKKKYSIFLAFSLLLGGVSSVFAATYSVATQAELVAIANDLTGEYTLTADIELTGEWTPIAGVFTGKLQGNHHAIKNILINTDAERVGLFSELGDYAVIEGVHIVGGNISSSAAGAKVGSIVSYISGTNVDIVDCSNTATISATGATAQVGGLVGSIKGNYASIISSFNKGDVTGGVYAGGLVGRAADSQNTVSILDSYSQAVVSSAVNESRIGGIAGYMYNGGSGEYTIENCYAAGRVVATGTSAYGAGIVGRSWNNEGTVVQHNLGLQEAINATGQAYAIQSGNVSVNTKENFSSSSMLLNDAVKESEAQKHGRAVALADAKTAAWYVENLPSWNFDVVWTIVDGSFPTLQWESLLGTGLDKVPADNDAIVTTKYYNLQGIEVAAPAEKATKSVYVVKNIHASGAVTSTKVVK